MEIRPAGVGLLYADGPIDKTKLTVSFRSFANALKKQTSKVMQGKVEFSDRKLTFFSSVQLLQKYLRILKSGLPIVYNSVTEAIAYDIQHN
jgi:hypothetical protein